MDKLVVWIKIERFCRPFQRTNSSRVRSSTSCVVNRWEVVCDELRHTPNCGMWHLGPTSLRTNLTAAQRPPNNSCYENFAFFHPLKLEHHVLNCDRCGKIFSTITVFTFIFTASMTSNAWDPSTWKKWCYCVITFATAQEIHTNFDCNYFNYWFICWLFLKNNKNCCLVLSK